ncbi:MAG: class I SAM-dependent methyltransferase [Bradymonadia bacterium]
MEAPAPAPQFSVNDIRPVELEARKKILSRQDREALWAMRHTFIDVPCPACGSTEHSLAFRKDEFPYVRCHGCDTHYITPRPPADLLARWYAESENSRFWNTHVYPMSEPARRARIFGPRVTRLLEIFERQGVHPGCLVEVGGGFGTFVDEAHRRGVFDRVIAIEPVPELAENIRRRGVEVIEAGVEAVVDESGVRPDYIDALPEGLVDMVASFEVIEHLYDPASFIQACGRLLRPGGLLTLTCPNAAGFDMATLGGKSGSFNCYHLNCFTTDALIHLVERLGFEVVEVMTPGALDAELVRQQALSGDIDLSGQPFLQKVLVDDWDTLGGAFQDFLAQNGMSSHLWLVARRPG